MILGNCLLNFLPVAKLLEETSSEVSMNCGPRVTSGLLVGFVQQILPESSQANLFTSSL